MNELALHLLDIIQNSFKANATLVQIVISEIKNCDEYTMKITIEDNGCGMNKDELTQVTNPFFTSRKTRKVGLGVPLFKEICENTGGYLSIDSQINIGTKIEAKINMHSIDALPLGNIVETLYLLAINPEECDIEYIHKVNDKEYTFDTRQVKEVLGNIPLTEITVIEWIKSFLEENEALLYK